MTQEQLEILQDALASLMQDSSAPHYVRADACAQYARACTIEPAQSVDNVTAAHCGPGPQAIGAVNQ